MQGDLALRDTQLSSDTQSPMNPNRPSHNAPSSTTSESLRANAFGTESPSPIIQNYPAEDTVDASRTIDHVLASRIRTTSPPSSNGNTHSSTLPTAANPDPPVISSSTKNGHRKQRYRGNSRKPEHPCLTDVSSSSTLPQSAEPLEEKTNTRRGWAILLAFAVIFFPMLVIVTVLLVFVFKYQLLFLSLADGTPQLPIHSVPPRNAYYTTVDIGSYLLVSSGASNIAQIVVAPFMLLFSFFVAREIARPSEKNGSTEGPSELLLEIISGELSGAWHWLQHLTKGRERAVKERSGLGDRTVHLAALGLILSGLLSVLVIVGDKWLHYSTEVIVAREFLDITYPPSDKSSSPTDFYASGWTTIDECKQELTAVLPQNISEAPFPCSLNKTDRLTNVADPSDVYLTLDTGISQQNSSFNDANFTALNRGSDEGTATLDQIVTFVDPKSKLSHSFLFYDGSAQEYDNGTFSNIGVDYVANTTSMVTECTFATQACGLKSYNQTLTNSSLSIPYHCYPDFTGDLNETPSNGVERAQGWNSSFYQLTNGTPENIPLQAQLNPFNFFAVAAVSSISLPELMAYGYTEAVDGSLIDAGGGRTAFALSCHATIFDVTYSLINASIVEFNATQSDPRKASIIKAPLQAGFGQRNLLQVASFAVLSSNPLTSVMSKSFSQTGMALASGAFTYDVNVAQRIRADTKVTKIPKAPFWFLIVSCVLVSTLGLVLMVGVLVLRRSNEVRLHQLSLVPKVWSEDFGIEWDGDGVKIKHGKDRNEKIYKKIRTFPEES